MPANFDVYPGVPGTLPTDPLLVAPNATVLSTFTQRTGAPVIAGSYVKMMFIRVGMVGSPKPTLSIQAGAGQPVEIVAATRAVYRGPETGANYVGDVQLITAGELADVVQIRMGFFGNTTETWQLGIKNNDATPREFTWVVAGTIADTAQPWVTVSPAALSIASLVNRPGEKSLTISKSVQVANKGTAPLVLDHLDPAPPPTLEVTTPLPLTVAVGQQADLVLRYTPPDAGPAQVSLTSTVVANPPDQTAGTAAGHNQQLRVGAAAQSLEVVLLLDDSGSMGTDALGHGLPVGSPNSRWAELISAANPFLDLLAHFGAGRGQFGIARFPASDPNNPSTFDLVPMTDITTNMAAAQTAVAAVAPFNSTPMGDGLNRVLGPTSYFSSQTGNRRWLVLMSDGAHNSGTHNPNEFLPPPASVTGPLADRGISLFGVAYGIEGHTDVNPILLKELAAGSAGGGQFRAVDTENVTASALSLALRDTIKSGLTAATSPLDPSAVFVIGPGEARHDVVITSYDTRAAFVLSWNTPDSGRLRLELLAPGGGRITPENAGTGDFAGVTFKGGDRSALYLVEPEFLRRKRGPAGQQSDGFGSWTFVVTSPTIVIGLAENPAMAAVAVADTETYLYDTIVESGLRIEVEQHPATSYAGDPITLSARITADGRPVRGAAVTLSTTKPTQSFANWLAGLQVPADALAEAEKQLAGQDHTAILVKQLAAQIAKLTFDGGTASTGVAMTDPDGDGVYRAVFTDTAVPEHHTFYVTATGVTDNGVSFRREGTRETFVLVRPDPLFSRLEILEVKPGESRVTISPRDRFGNVLLVDPATAGGFGVTATGATTTPLASGLNGSYTSTVTYNPATPPTIGATYGGVPVVTSVPTVPLAKLHYPDQVLAVTLGAIESANQHGDPKAALGSVAGKPADRFVSLGANGSVELGFAGQVVARTADNDLTVFVAPDRDLRSYRVDARAPGSDTWAELGRSVGITQSFALAPAGLASAAAVRITDTSGRTRDDALQPLSTPGVSVRGLGALSTVPAPKVALSPWPLTRKGQQGHPVRTLQCLLRERGHTVVVDGIFGPKTDAAVRAFQQEKHLQVDGIAGPITWPALSVTVKRGSEGDAVRGVQEELEFRNQSGGPGLAIDGKFGPKTEAAVRGFQQAVAVDVADFPVDGIVGPKTWQAMVSGMLSF